MLVFVYISGLIGIKSDDYNSEVDIVVGWMCSNQRGQRGFCYCARFSSGSA